MTSLLRHDTQQALPWVLPAILITLRLSVAPLILRPSLISFLLVFRAGTQPQSPGPPGRENDKLRFFLYFMRRKLFCEHSGLCSWNKPSWLWLLSCSVFKAQRGECLFKSFTAHFQNALASLWRWWYKINNLFRSHAAIIFLSPNLQNDLHCLLVIPEASHIDIFVQHFAGSINHVWIIDKPCWGNNDPSSIEQNNDLYCRSWFHRERENKGVRRMKMKKQIRYYGILRTVLIWIWGRNEERVSDKANEKIP